jgi:hypothetical protein
MATKSKLERAVEDRAGRLGVAQRELVLSQLSVYRGNNARMSHIKDRLAAIDSAPDSTLDEVRVKQASRSTLSYEYNQLSTANSRIAVDLFKLLEEI